MPYDINREVALKSVLQPIEKANGLPNETYTSDEFLHRERDQVLGKSWAGLWFAERLSLHHTLGKHTGFQGVVSAARRRVFALRDR